MDRPVLVVLCVTTIALGAGAVPAANAQSAFGDTSVSYQNGVVYDDDLVPGRAPNQSFMASDGDTTSVGSSAVFSSSQGGVRAPSQNLIGSDGRAIDAIRSDQRRATATNNILNSREF